MKAVLSLFKAHGIISAKVVFAIVITASFAAGSIYVLIGIEPAQKYDSYELLEDDSSVVVETPEGILRLPDSDNDKTPDDTDNCPDFSNPEQLDMDGDGEGDECDGTPFGDVTQTGGGSGISGSVSSVYDEYVPEDGDKITNSVLTLAVDDQKYMLSSISFGGDTSSCNLNFNKFGVVDLTSLGLSFVHRGSPKAENVYRVNLLEKNIISFSGNLEGSALKTISLFYGSEKIEKIAQCSFSPPLDLEKSEDVEVSFGFEKTEESFPVMPPGDGSGGSGGGGGGGSPPGGQEPSKPPGDDQEPSPINDTYDIPEQQPEYLSSGLLAYWSFDGNVDDLSENGNNGILKSGATIVEDGKIGGAIKLDGVDDYVEILNTPDLSDLDEMTISAWVKVEGQKPAFIFDGSRNYGNSDGFALRLGEGNQVGFAAFKGKDSQVWHKASSLDDWVHVVGVYNGTHRLIYVNGELKNSNKANGKITDSGFSRRIGSKVGSFGGTEFFKGKIDEVGVWGRALKQSEIEQLLTQRPIPATPEQPSEPSKPDQPPKPDEPEPPQEGEPSKPPGDDQEPSPINDTYDIPDTLSDLIAYYTFDEDAKDVSGVGNIGVLSGGSSIVSSGKIGGSLELDGEKGYVEIPESIDLKGDKVTISAWINPKKTNIASVFDSGGYSILAGVGIAIFSTGDSQLWAPNIKNKVGEWVHIAAVYDGLIRSIYVNGVLSVSDSISAKYTSGNSKIGGLVGNDQSLLFNGNIDELGIWNRALSNEEIKAIMETRPVNVSVSKPGRQTPFVGRIVAHWKLDSDAKDYSGNNSGVVYNAVQNPDGAIGGSYSFRQAGDYIGFGWHTNESKSYSVSLWFKAVNPSQGTIFHRGRSSNCFYNPGIFVSNGKLVVSESDCKSKGRIGGSNHPGIEIKTNDWNHVVVTRENNTVNVYVNGDLKLTDNDQPLPPLGTESGGIAAGASLGSLNQRQHNFFTGSVDDIIIWNKALSQEDVSSIFASRETKTNYWKYNRKVSFSTPTVTPNEVVKVGLSGFDYTKAKEDGGDIRFFDKNGKQLRYMVEKLDTKTNSVWVEIPESGTREIEMMYGNQYAISESVILDTGGVTYELVEDFSKQVGLFSDQYLGKNNWKVENGRWVASEGFIKNYYGGDDGIPDLLVLENFISSPGKSLKAKVRQTGNLKYSIIYIGWQDPQNYYALVFDTSYVNKHSSGGRVRLSRKVEGKETSSVWSPPKDKPALERAVWYEIELRWVSPTKIEAEIWDTSGESLSVLYLDVPADWPRGRIALGGLRGVSHTWFDDIMIGTIGKPSEVKTTMEGEILVQ